MKFEGEMLKIKSETFLKVEKGLLSNLTLANDAVFFSPACLEAESDES